MKKLDLKKYSIRTFERLEEAEVSLDTFEQDILRSWEFLKLTHTLEGRDAVPDLYSNGKYGYGYDVDPWNPHDPYDCLPDNEAVCIRALIDHKKTKRRCGSRELVILSFDDVGFSLYREFMTKRLFHRDAVYNFFYNIYKMDYVRGRCFRRATGRKMIGNIDNATSTNLLAVDLDAYSFEEYREIRKLFLDRGIIPIEVSSGHGFHILIKIETCTDKGLLAKWLKILSECGINVDQHCKDPGRVYRLPFFYNIKSAKYDTVTKAMIMEGGHGAPTYRVEDIFSRFGYDYQNWDRLCGAKSLNEAGNVSAEEMKGKNSAAGTIKAKKPAVQNKKEASRQQRKSITDTELDGMYPMLNTATLPEGIKSMLKGFVEGHAYYQLMCLVFFFKRSKCSLEQIKDIVSVAESINGNDWNSWDAQDMAECFFDNIYGMNADEQDSLEKEFGGIAFPASGSGLKVPLGVMKPSELKLYLYILRYGMGRKKEIVSFLHISARKLDRIMESAVLVRKDGLQYGIMDKKTKNYIYLSEEELDNCLLWNENEIAVWLYLKFRCNGGHSIQTSRESIKKMTLISHPTVTKAIQSLESRNLIAVTRKESQHHLIQELRESNIYTLLSRQSS